MHQAGGAETPMVLLSSRCLGLHPFVWLLGWLFLIAGLQGAADEGRLAGLCLFIVFFCVAGFSRFIYLCRKSGVLLFMTGLILAWRTPGETLIPTGDAFLIHLLPTYDGLMLAAWHLVNLLTFLAAAAFCLTLLNRSQILVGLYRILRWIPGVDEQRWTVRLFLVLEHVSTRRPAWSLSGFCQLLDTMNIPEKGFSSSILLKEPAVRSADWIITVLMALLVSVLWWSC